MFSIYSQPTDISSTQSMVVEVDIEYITMFYELRDIAGS